VFAPALKEKWDVEHDDRFSPRMGMGTKPLLLRLDHRVDDSLETRKSLPIAKYTLSEKRSINPLVARTNAGECHRNRCCRGATWPQ
jgi:hypothetical protein